LAGITKTKTLTIMSNSVENRTLTRHAASQLSTTTKSAPIMSSITPRWLLKLMPWVAVNAGTYRINKRKVIVKPSGRINLDIPSATMDAGHLRQIAMFRNASDQALSHLLGKFKSEKFSAGSQIIKEGAKSDVFMIITSGKVEVNRAGQFGEKQVLTVLSAGDWIGESALMDHATRTASATALIPTQVISLTGDQFQKALKDSPELRGFVEAAIHNRNLHSTVANEYGEEVATVSGFNDGVTTIAPSFFDYEDEPKEFSITSLQAILKIPTHIADIYNNPYDQVEEQTRLMIEELKERQEWEIINNPDYGLLAQVAPSMRMLPRKGSPTPDDMDRLLTMVWKKPAFFLAHPKAIAAFGRECTRRGVPPATVNIFGNPVITWRGVPIVPCNKISISDGRDGREEGTTSILLMRVGEKEQGVIGIHQPGIPNEKLPSLSVLFNGVSADAHRNYLISLYFSCAVLSDDALAVMDSVQVSNYYDY